MYPSDPLSCNDAVECDVKLCLLHHTAVVIYSCGRWKLVNLYAHLTNTVGRSTLLGFILQNSCWPRPVLTGVRIVGYHLYTLYPVQIFARLLYQFRLKRKTLAVKYSDRDAGCNELNFNNMLLKIYSTKHTKPGFLECLLTFSNLFSQCLCHLLFKQ